MLERSPVGPEQVVGARWGRAAPVQPGWRAVLGACWQKGLERALERVRGQSARDLHRAALKEGKFYSLPQNRQFRKYPQANGWKIRTCLLP